MFSRLWYFVVAALAGVGLAAGFIATETLDTREGARVQEMLQRDRAELELWLRYDARARLDTLAPMAAHPQVREALAGASSRRSGAVESSVREALGSTLAQLNAQLQEGAAQLLFAIDANGEIIAQLGGTTPPTGAGLAAFPVARRALDGYETDDVFMYGGEIYRAAARPVVHGGQYVGAIIHCSEIGPQLAQRLGQRIPGASLAFFVRERVVASHAASVQNAPGAQVMESGIAAALAAPELQGEGHTPPMPLGDTAKGVYALVTGTARSAGVGYVVARPIDVASGPLALFESVPEEIVAGMPWVLVIGIPLLLGLLGLLFVFLERDRPLRTFRGAVASLAAGEVQRLDETHLPGRFRKLGHDVNEGLDRVAGTGAVGGKPTADLDQILGTAPSAGSTPYFGFADGPDEPEDTPPSKPAALPPTSASLGGGPPAPPPAPPRPSPPMAVPDPTGFEEDESATMVARVPEELLAAAAASKPSEEEQHFREVFEQFVALKKQSGESTVGLTFDKLATTLRKNAGAIKAKHGVSRVRFTVYEKNGKAALKATPVK